MSQTIGFVNPHENKLRSGQMTLNKLLQEDENTQVYVLNNSDLNGLRNKGEIYIPIRTHAAGDATIIKIPNTWIPIDLTTFVPRKALIDSAEFRRAVQNGIIRLINIATAEEVLHEPEAREEQQVLLMQSNFIDDEALQALADKGGPDSEIVRKILAERQKNLAKGSGFEAGVTPAVVDIMNRENMGAREIAVALRGLGNRITEKDLHYIISKADVKTSGSTVIAWAREGLESFKNKK
jgi:hypothetical protein